MMDYLAMANQLRATRKAEEDSRIAQSQKGGAATSPGGFVGAGGSGNGGGMFQTGGYTAPQQNQNQTNPLQQGVDAYNKYQDMSKLLSSGSTAGAFSGATPATMSAMSAGGGSSLGSMGLMSSAPAASFPGAAAAGGSTGGAASGGAAGGAAGGGAAAAGGVTALAALGYLADKEMNENKGSFINADKINDMGSVNGIGLRFGDLANGFNPATWVSDPSKAAKGLGNFFTLGFLDKIM